MKDTNDTTGEKLNLYSLPLCVCIWERRKRVWASERKWYFKYMRYSVQYTLYVMKTIQHFPFCVEFSIFRNILGVFFSFVMYKLIVSNISIHIEYVSHNHFITSHIKNAIHFLQQETAKQVLSKRLLIRIATKKSFFFVPSKKKNLDKLFMENSWKEIQLG